MRGHHTQIAVASALAFAVREAYPCVRRDLKQMTVNSALALTAVLEACLHELHESAYVCVRFRLFYEPGLLYYVFHDILLGANVKGVSPAGCARNGTLTPQGKYAPH